MSEATDLEMLRRMVPELEAEGYEVYVDPNNHLIPGFLGSFRPDAIALRDDKNLVVEVARRGPNTTAKLDRLGGLLRDQPKWELRVVWVSPTSDRERLEVQSREAINARITEVLRIATLEHVEPALLMAWATFEALARAALPKQFGHPQTPSRILQVLASEGYLTPTEADMLRGLAEKRNRLIHGDLQIRISQEELMGFVGVLRTMVKKVKPISPNRRRSKSPEGSAAIRSRPSSPPKRGRLKGAS